MKQHLFILVFLTGAIPLVQPFPRKYYLIQQSKAWTDAQVYCRTTHTGLLTIESDDDMTQLKTVAQTYQFSSVAWVGLYNDINSWHWSLKNESLGSMSSWYPGEPNNGAGNEECVVVYLDGWHDVSCDAYYHFVCYDDRNNGTNRYIVYLNTKRWYEAQTFCRQTHTDLASTRNETELLVIKGKISWYTWFGLYRDSWKWLNQTNTSSTNFVPASKAYYLDCGYIYNGQTYGAACTDMKAFYCYRVITGQQQIIRVKVQSDQDLNDPAVNAVILEQIKKKLKELNMENVSIKWREQPVVKVFYKIK